MFIETPYGDMSIIYEDDAIAVIDKPHGLHFIQDRYQKESETVKSILEKFYGSIFIVHRLDSGTGGLSVCAKDRDAHKALCKVFEEQKVHKSYLCLTRGEISEPTILKLPISNTVSRGRYKINFKSGRYAETEFKPIVCRNGYGLIQAIPLTGRTHQIRVHLKALGAPLVKDRLYNKESLEPEYDGDNRITLFANELTFDHPKTLIKMSFELPLSPYMQTYSESFLGIKY